MAERDRPRLAAVLAADARLEPGRVARPSVTAIRMSLPDAVRIEHLERVLGEDAALDVARQEAPGVVAAQA